jgi:hypothetical protein
MSGQHITRYDVMPIPPIDAHTEWFRIGALTIGVEYRLVTEAIAAARQVEAATGSDGLEAAVLDDRGVSLHVVGEVDGVAREVLRFDCFVEDPHYHYVSWREKSNEVLHLDPVAEGDPLAWALERLRTRLPAMLARAGAPELGAAIDAAAVDAALPRIAEAASRLRRGAGDTT